MRFKLVLLFTFLIMAVSFQAMAVNCGTNWLGNDAVGNDPDFNVAAREQGYTPPASASTPSTSQAGSKSKVAPDERPSSIPKSEPNMDMPDPTPKAAGSSAQNVAWTDNSTQNQSSKDAVVATSNSPASALASSASDAKTTDVSGKWSVDLGESSGNYMDLVLIQSGKTIMGSGSLVEDGTKIPMTLSGTLDGDALDLGAKSIVTDYVDNKINREYKMSLTAINKMLLGSYEAYASRELMGTGNVTARRP